MSGQWCRKKRGPKRNHPGGEIYCVIRETMDHANVNLIDCVRSAQPLEIMRRTGSLRRCDIVLALLWRSSNIQVRGKFGQQRANHA
jgi:hypothetical protein